MGSKPGTTNNPHGRPKGIKNKGTEEALSLLREKRLPLMQKAVSMALEGNVPILQKLIDKIAPTLTENTNFTFEEWLKKQAKELDEYGV